jgi:hypothetical protein
LLLGTQASEKHCYFHVQRQRNCNRRGLLAGVRPGIDLDGRAIGAPIPVMSTRGTDLLKKGSTITCRITPAWRAVALGMVQELFADAKTLGIASNKIEQDTGSVYQAALDVIMHQQGAAAG